MSITPEIVAKLIFATTQLRFFEREYMVDPSLEMQDIVLRWQCKVDSILTQMGMRDFMPYNELLETLTTDNNLKQAV